MRFVGNKEVNSCMRSATLWSEVSIFTLSVSDSGLNVVTYTQSTSGLVCFSLPFLDRGVWSVCNRRLSLWPPSDMTLVP